MAALLHSKIVRVPELSGGVVAMLLVAAVSAACGRVGYDPSQRLRSHDRIADGGPSFDGEGGSTGMGEGGTGGTDVTGAGGTDLTGAGGTDVTGGSANAGGTPSAGGAAAGGAAGSGGFADMDASPGDGGTTGSGGSSFTDAGGCTGSTYGGHAYAFCSTPLAFADAAADCQSRSMRLARINDAAENAFIANLVFGATPGVNTVSSWPWFGASDIATPVQWQFVDGTVFWTGRNNGSAVGGLYTNWASASPSDASGSYCATMNNAGGNVWVDRRCTNVQPYVCEAY